MFQGFGESTVWRNPSNQSKMDPDAGAIIGITLGGALLIVALVFLCVFQFCCKEELKARGGRRRPGRPSTSSSRPIAEFLRSSHDVQTLSVDDLQRHLEVWNNPAQYGTGIINPIVQLHCHTCGVLAATSGLHRCHLHSSQISIAASNPCLFCSHEGEGTSNQEAQERVVPNNGSDRFQIFTPQLHSPLSSESPPPVYPGVIPDARRTQNENSSIASAPPPYSPKV